MFKSIVNTVKKVIDPYDDSSRKWMLEDPVASTIDWTPLEKGGSKIRTHKLVLVSGERMEFKPVAGAIALGIFMLLIGIFIGAGLSFSEYNQRSDLLSFPVLLSLALGVFIIAYGIWFIYSLMVPIVFDRMYGHYWKGWTSSDHSLDFASFKEHSALHDVHALQLIAEYCKGRKRSYLSYELNIVRRDGSRLNVVDHGDAAALRRDAAKLAEFLKVPLWDGA